ncbi:MAG: chemotaxis protein MotB [Rhodobacteraceae bacterium]|nr:chemotaxis protein MotB [Paracoccaceae bacterium]
MAGQANAYAIIKRKKVVIAGGHHGGAWKVAYADFVTAMMAFFMLMWLLNATTEKQRKGIADYFNPTIPVNRISGGGDGSFGGDSVLSEKTLAQNGTGASAATPTEDRQARGDPGQKGQGADPVEQMVAKALEKTLVARTGESMTMDKLLHHVITRVSDEGLIIDIFDTEGHPLFDEASDRPTRLARDLVAIVADVTALAQNPVAVNGHVHAYPMTLIHDPGWELSSARAQAVRLMLQDAGLPAERVARVAGFSDRKPAVANHMAARNNRIEIILLRRDR